MLQRCIVQNINFSFYLAAVLCNWCAVLPERREIHDRNTYTVYCIDKNSMQIVSALGWGDFQTKAWSYGRKCKFKKSRLL